MQLECLVRLVQMGCEVNTATSHFQHTPTHSAAAGGQAGCLVWLTQAGADVNRQVCHCLLLLMSSLESPQYLNFHLRSMWRFSKQD